MPHLAPVDAQRLLVADHILVNRAERTITFPAAINQRHGIIEYIVVHTSGKRHEALLVTDLRPQDIHFACLLVGAPAEQEVVTVKEELPQAAVAINWQRHGPAAHFTIEQLVLPTDSNGAVVDVGQAWCARWIYPGSFFSSDGFAAQQQGSIISLQADRAALMTALNTPTTFFIPFQQRLPAIGTPVSVVLTFPQNPHMSQKESP